MEAFEAEAAVRSISQVCGSRCGQGRASLRTAASSLTGVDAESLGEERQGLVEPAGLFQMPGEIVALEGDVGEKRVEAPFPGDLERIGKGRGEPLRLVCLHPGGPGQEALAGLGQKPRGFGLLHHLEMAGNVRLQRKLVEDRLAKGVDRLDLQPARRLQRAGEELAGLLHRLLARASSLGKLGQSVGQRRVRHGRPLAEPGKDTGRHFRRRRLGEGEAQNLRRIDAGQKQPHDPLGQDVGLAGAGIGRDEDRAFRIRRDLLAALGVLVDEEGL